jgi:hypothetical protein
MRNIRRVFTVDGQPFFPLAGQARNSSGYNDGESEAAFKAVRQLHGNTLEIPVYWEQVEPEEGTFDFSAVDALLARARQYEVRLVLLWFGTWKNGSMDYAPVWIKANPERFRRVLSPAGKDLWVLSSHCQANFDADRSAFTALCKHLQSRDSRERTVIAVQIENEPGILGSDRDYGPEAQAVYESPVPSGLIDRMKAADRGSVYAAWQAAGGKESGDWPDVFGWSAGEMMTAWSIAAYIDRLAEAGKAILDLPMYVNVWLGEQGWAIPGESYPSGGAVGKALDIYKWMAPHIDLIAPDIYIADGRGYEHTCAIYAREDNPFFVPESAPGGANAWNLFRAIADYGAIGYAFFAVEHLLSADGSVRSELKELVDSFHCLAAAIPLLLKYQGTGKIHAVIQEENLGSQMVKFDGYLGMLDFGSFAITPIYKDWRHRTQLPDLEPTPSNRARGLVFQADRHEFYLVGANYRLILRPDLPPEQAFDASLAKDTLLIRQVHYLSVDEGHFEADGTFVVDRRRNGDEINAGVWIEPDVGVVRVKLCD